MTATVNPPLDTTNTRQAPFWNGTVYVPRDTYVLDSNSVSFNDTGAVAANTSAVANWINAAKSDGAIARIEGSGLLRMRASTFSLNKNIQIEFGPDVQLAYDNSQTEIVTVTAQQSVFTPGVDFTLPVGFRPSRLLVDGATPLTRDSRGNSEWSLDTATNVITLTTPISNTTLKIEFGQPLPLWKFTSSGNPTHDLIIHGFSGSAKNGAFLRARQSNTLLDVVRARRLVVRPGYCEGGALKNGYQADGCITPTSCDFVDIEGGLITDFNDAAIYPTGGGDSENTDDGKALRIHGVNFENCWLSTTIKRQNFNWTYTGNTATDCTYMLTTFETEGIAAAYGGVFSDNVGHRIARRMFEARGGEGSPRAMRADTNQLIDFGYYKTLDGVLTRDPQAVAFDIRGATGARVTNNVLEMREWTPHADIIGVKVQEAEVNGISYTPGSVHVTDNDFLGGWITHVVEDSANVGPTKCRGNETHGMARSFTLLNDASFDAEERGETNDVVAYLFEHPGDSSWDYSSGFQRMRYARNGSQLTVSIDIQGVLSWTSMPPTGYARIEGAPYAPRLTLPPDSAVATYTNTNFPVSTSGTVAVEMVTTNSSHIQMRAQIADANDPVIEASDFVAAGNGRTHRIRFTLSYET